MELLKGLWCASLTEAPIPVPTDSFLKMPPIYVHANMDGAGDGKGGQAIVTPGNIMAAEAKIYEVLKQHGHPSICVYYGCVRDGDYCTALSLKKYERPLEDAVKNGDQTVDPDEILERHCERIKLLAQHS